jgi:hypothetical protein
MFSSITVAMDGTVLLFEEQREKGVVEVNPGGPVLLLGLQKKNLSPPCIPPKFVLHGLSSKSKFLAVSKGGHGYGLRPSRNPVSNWPARMKDWMHSSGWLKR